MNALDSLTKIFPDQDPVILHKKLGEEAVALIDQVMQREESMNYKMVLLFYVRNTIDAIAKEAQK